MSEQHLETAQNSQRKVESEVVSSEQHINTCIEATTFSEEEKTKDKIVSCDMNIYSVV